MHEALWPATVLRLRGDLNAATGAEGSPAAFLVPCVSVADSIVSDTVAEPLSEAVEPLCRFGWGELRRRLPSPPRLLTAQAAQDLQGALREDLARLLGPALSVELGIARASGSETVPAPATLARAALGSRDGLFTLFATYPVLASLCATLIDRWNGTVCDLLTRLVADCDAIGPLIRGGTGQPFLAGVEWGERPAVLGRPELLLRFTDGEQVRYVPRPLPSHAAFARFVEWLNACGAPHEFRTAGVVDRVTHGWVEHVEPQPCRDADDVTRFYQRAGAWVFLAWLLRATDLGNQDFVACGSHPVLTRPRVLQHRLTSTPVGLLEHTVLSTGLIGSWRLIDRAFRDVSVLPTGTRCGHGRVTAIWSGVDTGEMRVQFQMVPVEVTGHLPHLDGRHEPVSAHADHLIQGFRDTYSWFMRHRERLLRENAPLAELLSSPVDIAAYDQPGARLRSFLLTSPRLLEDGEAHRTAAEVSSLRFLSGICDELPNTGPLIAVEARAIASLSLPSLTAHPAGTIVRVQQEDGTAWEVPSLLAAPSAEGVRARIQGLSQGEYEEQVRLLRIAIGEPRLALAQSIPGGHAAPSPGDRWVKEALALAEHVVKIAARTPCGAPTWLTVAERPSRGLYQPTPLPPEGLLSQGGIAVFLAAAGRVAGRPDLQQHALRTLDPIRARLFGDRTSASVSGGSPAIPPDLPNGAVYGVGSLIFTLTVVGRLACDDGLIEEALALARHVTALRVQSDTVHDVYSGNAGLALALAALHDSTRERRIAPLLRDVGEHLLAYQVQAGDGRRAWNTSNGTPPLGGFSHGAAGISYALVRAFEVTGHSPLLEAAREAMAYEHELFAPDEGQWRDLRLPGSFMCSWCHGAPGIALARASVLRTLDDAVVRKDLERAVQATLKWPVENLDHLCCGNAGRVECLWVAASRLGSAELRESVLALASRVHAAAKARGRYAVDWPDTQDSPTFLRGLSGIGYQWLRLADPSLPSVLALA
jgi:type 2 lantibiotic biosynthesis protein LanM